MADEWFRSPDWSPEAQQDFEARLRRARSYNRAQYLRIKGLALHGSGEVEGARSLWLRILDGEDDAEFERAFALELLADSYVDQDPVIAEGYYRDLLARDPRLNGPTTETAEISLAELLIDKGDRASLEEARALLDSFLEGDRGVNQFPSVLFRWHLALIRIAEATGDEETVRASAVTALDLADRGPVFPRHKDVGVVHADIETLQRLRRLSE